MAGESDIKVKMRAVIAQPEFAYNPFAPGLCRIFSSVRGAAYCPEPPPCAHIQNARVCARTHVHTPTCFTPLN